MNVSSSVHDKGLNVATESSPVKSNWAKETEMPQRQT